jgi:spore germination protein KA
MRILKRKKQAKQAAIQKKRITTDLKKNVQKLEEILLVPQNSDIAIRTITVSQIHKKASLVYIQSITNTDKLEEHVITPLTTGEARVDNNLAEAYLIKSIINSQSVETHDSLNDLITQLNNGNTILMVDGLSEAFVLGTSKFAHRSIESAQDEKVIKGPKEGFTEDVTSNISLIRKRLRDKNLIIESDTVGERSKNNVSILYVKDIVNEDILSKVKERIEQVEADNVQGLSLLEQYIEDRPNSLVPTILNTERPDRAVSYLEEGHVVLLMDSSPGCLVCPATFWTFFHSPEDHNLKRHYGNFGRLIRMLAFFISIFVPAIYISISTYHTEMLPTDLLLAVAATREKVPFPAIIEVFFMEIAFEILREAGVRIPSPIGPTIGIVGALILGQAAVEATLTSPIMVIVIAITGLSSFAISDISFNYMLRITRFILTLSAALFGIFGIAITFLGLYSYLVMVESFGVPFLSPLAPYTPSSKDTFFRRVLSKEKLRPLNLSPKDKVRE